jgi:eukaryotic-like serine/threonine-protein kinase
MTAQLIDLAAPPRLPSDAELEIPRGADPESAIIGPIAGRYDLGERIARGGMGIVYRAHDRLLNRTVAVKVMRGKYMDRPDMLRRFIGEARINGKLQHPGIVPVYEVGTLPDARPFIAMKLIEGRTLARMLRERADPAENLSHFLKVFEALCQTMAYAHQQGVIHRDLKPDNIMVGEFGEVQVMDWGLAKFLDPSAALVPTPDGFEAVEKSSYLSADGHTNTPAGDHQTQATAVVPLGPDTPGVGFTTAGEVFGTLAYMPPEQARGETDRVDRRGDVFSLGAILCQILTGQPPYYGPPETLRQMSREGRLFGAYILLDRCGADQALVLLAKHCLAIDPEARPANAGVLAELVTECLEGLQDRTRQIEVKRLKAEARVAEAEAREKLARQARRLARTLAVVGVMVAAMLATGLGWYAKDRWARDADESRRSAAAMEQIEKALAEAMALEQQACTEGGDPLLRDAAARQAVSAYQRAAALYESISNPPDDIRGQLEATQARITRTSHGAHVAVELAQLHRELFDSRGGFDAAAAAQQYRETLSRNRIEVLGRETSQVAVEINDHPAADRVRESLIDWIAVTPDAAERSHLAAILNESGHPLPEVWLAALNSEDLDASARLADDTTDVALPAIGIVVAAHRLEKAGRLDDAERLLTRWVRRYPGEFNLNAQLGTLLRSRPGKGAEAIRYLSAANAARPNDPHIGLELGAALADAGRADESVELLRTAAKNNPKPADAHVRLGDQLLMQGDADGARACYASAVAADPNHLGAQLGLGRADLLRDDFDTAERAFLAANKIKPTATAYAGMGRIHLKRWEASKSAAAYRAAIELEPTAIEHRLGLVEAMRISNDNPGAIREAKAATVAAPTAAAAHRVLGDLLRASGDQHAAASAYRSAVKHDPADAESQIKLASLCESLDDAPGAAQAYQAAAELRPDDLKLQTAAARMLQKTGDSTGAIRIFGHITTKEPNNAAARRQLGQLLLDRNDDAAIEHFTKAADAEPKSPELRLELAEALLFFGKFRPAANAYRAAAERFPSESDKQVAAQQSYRDAMRWAGLQNQLPLILSGQATASSPRTWADFGAVCRHTGRFAAAARFFTKAAEGDEKHASSVIICQTLAGFGRGIDANELSTEERTKLRQSALAALQKNRSLANDRSLRSLKDSRAIESLPTDEREAWKSLWQNKAK